MSTPGPAARPASSLAQLIRTSTAEIKFAPLPVPEAIRLDTLQSVREAIRAAEQFVYIENQYFRLLDVAEWIIDAAKMHPGLQCIVVLPVRPEEDLRNPFTRHGNALQKEALKKRADKLGTRFGLFTLVSPTPIAPSEYLDSRRISEHSKAWIVDDRYALIESANVNARGFFVE